MAEPIHAAADPIAGFACLTLMAISNPMAKPASNSQLGGSFGTNVNAFLASLPWALAVGAVWSAGPAPASALRWALLQIAVAIFAIAAIFELVRSGALPDIAAGTYPGAWKVVAATSLVYATVWGLCQTIMLWRDRNRLNQSLVEAETRRLRTQINPHFLYNTLNAISELGYHDPQAADGVITKLGNLLRKSLDESNQQEISLRDEIEFLGRYLDIQKVLLRDRLQWTMNIDERTLNARVPGMIAQPLAENALTHGIGRDGVAHVGIHASRDGETLVIEVEDEGAGLVLRGDATGRGIGLANIRARLKHLYGDAARLELRDRSGGGLMARLVIPFHEAYSYDEAARADRR